LGIAVPVQIAVVVPTASAQVADQHACSVFPPSDLLRITGRNDIGAGPAGEQAGRVAGGCHPICFLKISMTPTQNITPALFARNR